MKALIAMSGGVDSSLAAKLIIESGFINAHKPDSQDFCFAPNGDYASAIGLQTGRKSVAGNFIDKDEHILREQSRPDRRQ